MFSVFVHHLHSAVPTLTFELSSDEAAARRLAARLLVDSPEHLLVEVREDDQLVFSLDRNGVVWPAPAERARAL